MSTIRAGALVGLLDFLQIQSVLDVGAGTGRTLVYLREKRPALRVFGIEPVPAQRMQAYSKGISDQVLLAGDATAIQFGDGEFDLVCEFGVLHHIRDHRRAVAEMLRVAKKAVFFPTATISAKATFWPAPSSKRRMGCISGAW